MTINALDGFQQRQANRWLAIASYPKDRTRVFLLFPDSNDLFRSVIGNQIGVNTNLRNGMVRGPQFILGTSTKTDSLDATPRNPSLTSYSRFGCQPDEHG